MEKKNNCRAILPCAKSFDKAFWLTFLSSPLVKVIISQILGLFNTCTKKAEK